MRVGWCTVGPNEMWSLTSGCENSNRNAVSMIKEASSVVLDRCVVLLGRERYPFVVAKLLVAAANPPIVDLSEVRLLFICSYFISHFCVLAKASR